VPEIIRVNGKSNKEAKKYMNTDYTAKLMLGLRVDEFPGYAKRWTRRDIECMGFEIAGGHFDDEIECDFAGYELSPMPAGNRSNWFDDVKYQASEFEGITGAKPRIEAVLDVF